MFDALVQELTSRFDLGGRAGALVRTVLTYIFQEEPGGLNAFLDRFRKAGLGDLVGSWIGNSSPRELTMGQLEGALGSTLLGQLAEKAGLSVSKAKPALALLLPRLIGMLTADGKVPSVIPAGVTSWLGGTPRTVGTYRAEPVAARSSMWTWLIPLLGLAALALLWALWPTIRAVPPATTPSAPALAPPAVPPATTELWPVKIYFATDSTTIGTDDSARIQRAADYLKANPEKAVDITGFADKTGDAATNEELAKERAKAVRDALVTAGVPESQTNLAPPASVTGAASDTEARRVEIRLKL
jgi:uncharacterized protein YidB (DUF937 family)